VVQGDLLEREYPANFLDAAVVLYVLEHVPYPRLLLAKIFKQLKPGGYLLLAVPNYRYYRIVIDNPLVQLLYHPSLHPAEHLHNFTPPTLARMVTEERFSVVQWSCARPLNTGSLLIRSAKYFAYGAVSLFAKCGYILGGVHLIARKI
jgi:SAM-dependent methyltransferase